MELLSRLDLVRPADLRATSRHARRLAKDLTLFDSVWVDALVQARQLTPYQAAEINAGRAEDLRLGPYVLLQPLPAAACTRTFRARSVEDGAEVRLSESLVRCDHSSALAELEPIIERCRQVAGSTRMLPILQAGSDGGRLWIASTNQPGRTASEWLVHGGRMPGDVVLEIARQMCATLALCEAAGLLHGDVSAQRLILDPLGGVHLVEPGLRGVLRKCEDATCDQIEPEAFDYLAPERCSGAPISATAEIYSCALVWWHLLAGRAPRTGATAAARREAARAANLRPIQHIAPDTPTVLVKAIALAAERDPLRRPGSFAALLDLLGPSSDRGQAAVARYVAQGATPPDRLVRRIRTLRRSPHSPTWAAAAGGVVLACALGTWPLWQKWVVSAAADSPPPRDTSTATVTAATRNPPGESTPPPPRTALPVHGHPATAIAATPPPDSRVVPTAAHRAAAADDDELVVAREFVIGAGRPIPWSQIRVRAGQVVRARPGERAQVVLPPTGAALAIEDLRFVDIDFIMPRAQRAATAAITVTAARATFERCSWQLFEAVPTAIDWTSNNSSVRQQPGDSGAPGLALRHGVIIGPAAAVRIAPGVGATLALEEVLFLGEGPFVGVAGSARSGAYEIQLTHCTVRGARCAISLNADDAPGPVRVSAHGCVFAPQAGGPVLLVAGGPSPSAVLRLFEWQGDGSVVTPESPIVRWQPATGAPRAVADAQLKIAGLVRTKLGFAGLAAEGPAASRLVSWQVPLRASQPPGIGEFSFALPAP